MSYTTIISAQDLFSHLDDPDWAILDCRFDLQDIDVGERQYIQAHIPGAVYAHLEHDLSAPPTGSNGRHPMPSVENLAAVLSRWGIGPGVQVVAYDARGGGFAARLWWSLHYLGHDAAAVLDGGFPAWLRADYPTRSGEESRSPRNFKPTPRPFMRVDLPDVRAALDSGNAVLLDARAPERYRGEEEPLDPVAGHIPGAINHFWRTNLDDKENFLPAETLRMRFETLLGKTPPDAIIGYCGSGVTSCHNTLALTHAGFEGARLYPGSWSEWCADPDRPIATEEEPSPGGTIE
jgi:thiosulfate/3-mercaptopyruvate sulfurtransferase